MDFQTKESDDALKMILNGKDSFLIFCGIEKFDLVLVLQCLDMIELAFCQKTGRFAPFSCPFMQGFSFFLALSMGSLFFFFRIVNLYP